MTGANREVDREVSMKPSADTRAYELVTANEFGHLRSKDYKHRDLHRAIREMKHMPVGQGVKLKCFGTARERGRKRKAAMTIAARAAVPVRTMLRGDWLFIEKVG